MARVAVRLAMTGDKAMRQKLERVAGDQGMRKQARAAASEVWGSKVPEMQARTPIKTGKLRASEHMKVAVSSKKEDIRLTLIAGGPTAPYARFVHDNLTNNHPRGGEAQFMLKTLLEAARTAAADIGAKIDLKQAAGA